MNSVQTICGYPVEELILFATACRRQGIREEDMKDFATNCGRVYDFIMEEMQKQFLRMINEN